MLIKNIYNNKSENTTRSFSCIYDSKNGEISTDLSDREKIFAKKADANNDLQLDYKEAYLAVLKNPSYFKKLDFINYDTWRDFLFKYKDTAQNWQDIGAFFNKVISVNPRKATYILDLLPTKIKAKALKNISRKNYLLISNNCEKKSINLLLKIIKNSKTPDQMLYFQIINTARNRGYYQLAKQAETKGPKLTTLEQEKLKIFIYQNSPTGVTINKQNQSLDINKDKKIQSSEFLYKFENENFFMGYNSIKIALKQLKNNPQELIATLTKIPAQFQRNKSVSAYELKKYKQYERYNELQSKFAKKLFETASDKEKYLIIKYLAKIKKPFFGYRQVKESDISKKTYQMIFNDPDAMDIISYIEDAFLIKDIRSFKKKIATALYY